MSGRQAGGRAAGDGGTTRLAPTLLASIVLLAVSAACVAGPAPPEAARPATPVLRVAASTPIFADIIANVGGERVAAIPIIPPDADPHTYEAAPHDLLAVAECDLFVFMGNFNEAFIEKGAWRRAVADAGVPEVKLADHLSLITVDLVIDHGDHVHDLRAGDPHVWLDPGKVIEMLPVLERALAERDPAGAAAYAANAARYRDALRALEAEMQAGIDRIPPDRRKLVVFHDAYRYFAARYSFEVVGIVLKTPGGEPSAEEIADLHRTIQATGVPVIFKEPQFRSVVVEQLAADTGVRVGELLTDNFVGRVESYIDLMRFNLRSLVDHLAAA